MDTNKLITTGYMAKKGSGFPYHIQDRMFSLYCNRMEYYTVGGTFRKSFPLNKTSYVVNLGSEEVENKAHSFKLYTGSKHMCLYFTSEANRVDWIKAIEQVVIMNGGIFNFAYEEVVPVVDPAFDELDQLWSGIVRASNNEVNANHAEVSQLLAVYIMDHIVEYVVPNLILEVTKDTLLQCVNDAQRELQEQSKAEKLLMNIAKCYFPIECYKNLNTESESQLRYVWLDKETNEFCWSKSEIADVKTAKRLKVKDYITGVEEHSVANYNHPVITIHLNAHKQAPGVFATNLIKRYPQSITITVAKEKEVLHELCKLMTQLLQ